MGLKKAKSIIHNGKKLDSIFSMLTTAFFAARTADNAPISPALTCLARISVASI